MVGFALRNTLSDYGTVARGICEVDERGLLKRVVEHTAIAKVGDHAVSTLPDGSEQELTGDEWVSMNMWGFFPSMLQYLEDGFVEFLRENVTVPKSEYFLPAVVDGLINRGVARTKVLRSLDEWFGVTYQEDKPHVIKSIQQLIDKGLYPSSLWE